ncbi:hypothetical protein SCP_0203370 [Sparassis crispa]|uniref:Dicer-like protein n=1 Tax=Sparassis crispa TaxID=139825 RepID=A0A401GAE4_9APHY|nr:hypothetical protein SCP_0203370 [Sparassis crispa]GBE79140.1 hypothetical protein SCP_0203370 [Sparassis crispa]
MFGIWKEVVEGSRQAIPSPAGEVIDIKDERMWNEDSARTSSTSFVPSRRTRTIGEMDFDLSRVDESSRPSKKRKTNRSSSGTISPKIASGNFRVSSSAALTDEESERVTGLPAELVVLYRRHCLIAAEPTLSTKLRELDTERTISSRVFKSASQVFCELGSYAAELFWRDWSENNQNATGPAAQICTTMKKWNVSQPHFDVTASESDVSPKFVKFVEVLKGCAPYGETFRGVVIVRRRVIAQAIVRLLQALQDRSAFIRPAVMTGRQSNIEVKDDVIRSFRRGTCNLLVITRSGEDLDIPKASIVICFDLFESQVSFAYSCALSIGPESHLVHMVEKDNSNDRRILLAIATVDDKMRRWVEKVASSPCSAIPPRTLHEALDPYLSDSDDEADEADCIHDPTTGGVLLPRDATSVIYRFLAASDVRMDDALDGPLFEFQEHQSGIHTNFTCSVHLPRRLSVSAVSGSACRSKAEARRAACFEACRQLINASVLDYRFFPQQHCWMTTTGMAELGGKNVSNPSLTTSGTHSYPRRRSAFWSNTLSLARDCLYPTIVLPGSLQEQHYAPVLILTRSSLPNLPDFSVFTSGFKATVKLLRGAPLYVDHSQLHLLHAYTLRLCRAVSNKPFNPPIESLLYFFAPLSCAWENTGDTQYPSVGEYIPWELVKLAAKNFMVPVISDEHAIANIDDRVEDAVIQDRWIEFTNRFFVSRVRHDLSPMSKVDDNPRGAEYANFVEYLKAHRKGFEGLKIHKQPIIEVSPVPVVTNYLTPTAKPLLSASKLPAKYLIPELCVKFTIPASTFRTVLLLPSLIHKIDNQLLVKELNTKFFENSISDEHLLAALCAPSACAEYDYERLELLGDAFLKFMSSIYCYMTMPSKNEGGLHASRQQIISNKALKSGAVRVGLPPYIQSKPFAVKLWQPTLSDSDGGSAKSTIAGNEKGTSDELANPGEFSQLSGAGVPVKRGKRKKQREDVNIQWLGDKTVADVVEGIIGAAYLTAGQELALRVTTALTGALREISRWSDFAQQVIAPSPVVIATFPGKTQEAVEAILGCKFKEPRLLAQALTHPSINAQHLSCYDRLEFLGDAILDFFVVRYIFHRNPQLSPGGLTLLKAAMVSNHALAAFCVSSGLYRHFRHASPDLQTAIKACVDKLETYREEECARAERERREVGQYWLEVDPPKALSDIVESLIGALYISDDFSEGGVEVFFNHALRPFYDQYIRLQSLSHHPNKTLFELLHGAGCHQHRVVKTMDGGIYRYDVMVHEIILATATSSATASAMRWASSCAIDALEGDPEFMMRTCDCRTVQTSKKMQKDERKVLGYEED